jgi:hypothetical protein
LDAYVLFLLLGQFKANLSDLNSILIVFFRLICLGNYAMSEDRVRGKRK